MAGRIEGRGGQRSFLKSPLPPPAIAASDRAAIVRLVSVTTVIGLYALFVARGAPRLGEAEMLIGVGTAYSIALFTLDPVRRFPFVATSYAVATFDAVLALAWIGITGGVASPYVDLLYVGVLLSAFRYGFANPYAMAGVYAAGLAIVAVAFGTGLDELPRVAARSAFLFLTAAVGAGMTRLLLAEERSRHEISERMAAAMEETARFRDLLEAAPDAMIVVGSDGRIGLVNSQAEKLFGYSREELLGKPVESLMPEAVRGRHLAHREEFARNPHARPMGQGMELQGRRKDGAEFPIEVSLSPVKTEGGPLTIAAVRDVTERRIAEETRLRAEVQLREIERLKEEDRFKTHFINTAAHELGTPLTPMKLQLHLLRADSAKLEARHQKAVEILERNTDRLIRLVQDVLDVARLQAHHLGIARQEIDVNRLVLEAVESFQESAKQAKVELQARLAPSATVEGDAQRVNQILFNLLSNAIKFTPAGGRVTVETSRGTQEILVRVRDTGIGLAPEQIALLFKPFSQVHNTLDSPYGGTGLGLYISRGLVELHGGRAWAESPGVGAGSTFTFTIPTGPPRETAREERQTVIERARELV